MELIAFLILLTVYLVFQACVIYVLFYVAKKIYQNEFQTLKKNLDEVFKK